MASEYVTVTPTFTGMTYDELVKPLETMQTAYDTAEQGMFELGANADKWAKYAQQNPVLGAKYNSYMSDLQNAAGDLMQTGNVRNAHSNMLKLYRRYQSDVQPIETCATAKSAAVTKMRETQEKSGGTTIFEFDPSLVSLDEIYQNPDLLDSNKSVNGKDIAERTKEIMENFAKADCANMSQEQWNGFIYGLFGPQYYEAVINKGYSPQQIAEAIRLGDESIFGYIRDLVLEPTGIMGWRSVNGDKNTYNYQIASKYVEQAFWSGMGEAQRLQVENKDYSILGRMATSGVAGGQNPNDTKPIYVPVERMGSETKAMQKARDQYASDAATLSKFLADNPNYTDGDIGHVRTDEEFDALQRRWAAENYHRVGWSDGEPYYPEISTYEPEKQEYIKKNGPKPGSWVYESDELRKIDNLIRKYNIDEDGRAIPWDGSKHMLEQTLAELNYKAQNREFNNTYQFLTKQPQVIAEYITNPLNAMLTAGTNGAKIDSNTIWTENYNKKMREKDAKADKDALLSLAEGKNIRSVEYDPAKNCFRFYVVVDKTEKSVCVSAKGLFPNAVVDMSNGMTLDDLADRMNKLCSLPNPSKDDINTFNNILETFMSYISNSALGLPTQGEPATSAKVSAGYINPSNYFGNDDE